jgi:hypothetical protein
VQIRAADGGVAHFQENFIVRRFGVGDIFHYQKVLFLKNSRFHVPSFFQTGLPGVYRRPQYMTAPADKWAGKNIISILRILSNVSFNKQPEIDRYKFRKVSTWAKT